jgi:hypothetical protein
MQVNVTPAVSPETVVVLHPVVDTTPVGSHVNATVTLDVYQPAEQPPPLQLTLIGGPALAAAAGRIRTGARTSSDTTSRRRIGVLPQ